jgi:hypothetical protein
MAVDTLTDHDIDAPDLVIGLVTIMQDGGIPYLEAEAMVRAMFAEYWNAVRLAIMAGPSKLVH